MQGYTSSVSLGKPIIERVHIRYIYSLKSGNLYNNCGLTMSKDITILSGKETV